MKKVFSNYSAKLSHHLETTKIDMNLNM